MKIGQHSCKYCKHGVTMNTDKLMHAYGLRRNVLYAVLNHSDELYLLYGPGVVDGAWVHVSRLNFEGPSCMFKKEV